MPEEQLDVCRDIKHFHDCVEVVHVTSHRRASVGFCQGALAVPSMTLAYSMLLLCHRLQPPAVDLAQVGARKGLEEDDPARVV